MAITLVGNSTAAGASTTLSPAKISGLADDDVCIAWQFKQNDAGTPATSPSGWTSLAENSTAGGFDRAGAVWYKVITNAAGEPSTWGFDYTSDTSVDSGIVVVAFRGVDTASPIDSSPANLSNQANTSTPGSGTTTTVAANAAVVSMAMMNNGGGSGTVDGWAKSSGPGTLINEAANDDVGGAVAWSIQASAGGTTEDVFTANNLIGDNDDGYGYQLSLKPAAGGAPTFTPKVVVY